MESVVILRTKIQYTRTTEIFAFSFRYFMMRVVLAAPEISYVLSGFMFIDGLIRVCQTHNRCTAATRWPMDPSYKALNINIEHRYYQHTWQLTVRVF